jgi:hypothetical protein
MKAKISFYDVEELACYICGLNDDADVNEIENALIEKFNISLDDFHKLCEHLLPLIDVGKGISGEMYKGFGVCRNNYKYWLVKMKIE